MRHLKRFESLETNYELLDIFSELELELPVRVEYFSPLRTFSDFDYEAICIIPESKISTGFGFKDNRPHEYMDDFMSKIDSIIQKAEKFGYNKVLGRTLPWCLIEATIPDNNFVSSKCHKEDSIKNWNEWWIGGGFNSGPSCKVGNMTVPITISWMNIYFEK